jgi:hypothetical protein
MTSETEEFTGVPTFDRKRDAVAYAKRKAAELGRAVGVDRVVRLSYFARTVTTVLWVHPPEKQPRRGGAAT